MLKDSNGNELSKKILYHLGEVETPYFFNRYITESIALFSSKKNSTKDDPFEFVFSQREITEKGVYPLPDSKDKNSGLESAISQSSPKCIIEKS